METEGTVTKIAWSYVRTPERRRLIGKVKPKIEKCGKQ